MAKVAIDTRELKAFRRSLKDRIDGKAWERTLTSETKKAGDIIAAEARSNVAGMGGAQAVKAATRIQAASAPDGIRLRMSNTKGVPYALAFIYGIKRRTGWFARARFKRSSGVQHPNDWVGNDWEVGVAGEGPHGVNDAIAAKGDEALDLWASAMQRVMNEI